MTENDFRAKRIQYIQEMEDALTNHDDAWVTEVWRKIEELDLARRRQPQLDEDWGYYHDEKDFA